MLIVNYKVYAKMRNGFYCIKPSSSVMDLTEGALLALNERLKK